MNKILLIVFVSLLSCLVKAAEVLDVLVVYDTNSVASLPLYDTEAERSDVSKRFVLNLNNSFVNSGLGNDIQFRLVASVLRPIKTSASEGYNSVLNRYRAQSPNNKARNNPVLTLNTHQKSYKADVVIGVMNFMDRSLAGVALYTPGKDFQTGGFSSLAESIGFADYGIVFLNATENIQQNFIVSHEVGHSMGLRHGQDQDGANYNIYFPVMFTAAEAYSSSELTTFGVQTYGTIMKGNKVSVNNNVFSSLMLYKCGAGPILYGKICGSSTKDAVTVLRAYKSYYNKRGAWYGNGYFLTLEKFSRVFLHKKITQENLTFF